MQGGLGDSLTEIEGKASDCGGNLDVGMVCTADLVLHDLILAISVMIMHEWMKRNGSRGKARGIGAESPQARRRP